MARKLILTILALALAALELLAVRQAQLNTVHQMTQLHREINSGNTKIDALRIEIESACSPSVLKNTLAIATDGN